MFFLGNVVGCLIFTTISDKFGRLKVFLITLWLQGVLGVMLAFSHKMGGLPTYLILRYSFGYDNVSVCPSACPSQSLSH